MSKTIIINRLLEKYENSKHLSDPGVSNRRVMLRVGSSKKELPEYEYENASIRDSFNESARSLEQAELISAEWVKGRPVLSCIVLNLDRVMDCYRLVGRTHPKDLALQIASMIETQLTDVTTAWILSWKDVICSEARQQYKIPAYCKKNLLLLKDLLQGFVGYDSLHGDPITMRAFSSKCYHDTKYFERNVRDMFLRIAQKFDSGLAQACEHEELSVRDQLAYLGIYARPELYELSGEISIHTATGLIDLHAAGAYGLALPSTSVDSIAFFDLLNINRVIFIENKTNYDEYILSERQPSDLVVYHGGFLSPQKKTLFGKIASAMPEACNCFFWADIDLGGFQMYSQLQKIIPKVMPMRMSGDDVIRHHHNGLLRQSSYLDTLVKSPYYIDGSPFKDAVDRILEYGVTIEQESFLSDEK